MQTVVAPVVLITLDRSLASPITFKVPLKSCGIHVSIKFYQPDNIFGLITNGQSAEVGSSKNINIRCCTNLKSADFGYFYAANNF